MSDEQDLIDYALIHEIEDAFHIDSEEEDGYADDDNDNENYEDDEDNCFSDDNESGRLEESVRRAQLEAVRQELKNAAIAEQKQERELASFAFQDLNLSQRIPGLGRDGVDSDTPNVDRVGRLEMENANLLARNSELQDRINTYEKARFSASQGSTEEQLSNLQFQVYDQKTGLLAKIHRLESENQQLRERESSEGRRNIENSLEEVTDERDRLRHQLDGLRFDPPVEHYDSGTRNHPKKHDGSSIKGSQAIISLSAQSSNSQHNLSSKCDNCDEMQRQLDTLTQAYTSNVMQKDTELQAKAGEIKSKDEELKMKERAAEDAKTKLEDLASKFKKLDAVRQRQHVTIDGGAKTIIKLNEEKDDMHRKLAKYKEKLDASQRHVSSQKSFEEANDPELRAQNSSNNPVGDFGRLHQQCVVERETNVNVVTELQKRLEKNRKDILDLQDEVRRLGGAVENTLLGTPARVLIPSNADVNASGEVSKITGDIATSLTPVTCDQNVESRDTSKAVNSLQACNENLEKKDRIIEELHNVVESLMAQVQAGGDNPYLPAGAEEGLRLALRESRGSAPFSDMLRGWLIDRDELLNQAHNVIQLLTAQVQASGLDAEIPAALVPPYSDRRQSSASFSEGLKNWLFARDVTIRHLVEDIKQARTVEIPSLEVTVENIQPTIIQLDSQIVGLRNAIGEMDVEVQFLRHKVATTETEQQTSSNIISTQITELEAVNADLQQKIGTIELLQTRIEALEAEIALHCPKQENSQQRQEGESESEAPGIKELQQQREANNDALVVDNVHRQEQLKFLEGLQQRFQVHNYMNLDVKITALLSQGGELVKAQERIAELEAAFNNLQERVDTIPDLQTYIAALEKELEALRGEQAGESESAKNLQDTSISDAQFRQQLTGYHERLLAQTVINATLRGNLAEKLQTDNRLQNEIAELTVRITQQEATIRELEQRLNYRQEGSQRLQAQFDEPPEVRVEKFDKIERNHKRELAAADKVNNALGATISELNGRIVRLEATERDLDKQVTGLMTQNTNLAQQVQEFPETVAAALAAAQSSAPTTLSKGTKKKNPKKPGTSSRSGADATIPTRKVGGIGKSEIAGLGAGAAVGGRATRSTRNVLVDYREGMVGGRVRKRPRDEQDGGERTKILKLPVAKGPRKRSLAVDPDFVDSGDTGEDGNN